MFLNNPNKKAKLKNAFLDSKNTITNEDNSFESISSYKDLTLRKTYRKISIKYLILLLGLLLIEILALLFFEIYNPAYLIFVAFTAVGTFINLLDFLFLNISTRKLDSYTKLLSEKDLNRIERHTKNLGHYNQLVFLEKEMILIQSSVVKLFAYEKINSVTKRGLIVELFDSNDQVI